MATQQISVPSCYTGSDICWNYQNFSRGLEAEGDQCAFSAWNIYAEMRSGDKSNHRPSECGFVLLHYWIRAKSSNIVTYIYATIQNICCIYMGYCMCVHCVIFTLTRVLGLHAYCKHGALMTDCWVCTHVWHGNRWNHHCDVKSDVAFAFFLDSCTLGHKHVYITRMFTFRCREAWEWG